MRFQNEKEQTLHFSFKSADAIEEFQTRISDYERRGIHQYGIAPVNHDEKPTEGEILFVTEE